MGHMWSKEEKVCLSATKHCGTVSRILEAKSPGGNNHTGSKRWGKTVKIHLNHLLYIIECSRETTTNLIQLASLNFQSAMES